MQHFPGREARLSMQLEHNAIDPTAASQFDHHWRLDLSRESSLNSITGVKSERGFGVWPGERKNYRDSPDAATRTAPYPVQPSRRPVLP
jgi:hypothetical protein